MEYLSIWDQRNRKFIKNGYKPADLTIEFQRTKNIKISDHSLAQVTFNSRLDRNKQRNEVIARDIGKLTTTGFRYETIGNVFSPDPLEIEEGTDGGFEILAHGTPTEGDLNGGNENCAVEGLKCKQEEGTDKDCNPGKCIIGKLHKVSEYKWKYTSEALYGDAQQPVTYYLGGKEILELKTIIRGVFDDKKIDKSASKSTLIYLPPTNYLDRVFKDEYFKVFNSAFSLDGKTDELNGIVSTEEDFLTSVLTLAYRDNLRINLGSTVADLADKRIERVTLEVIYDKLFNLDEVWKKKIADYMESRWDQKIVNGDTNRTFITYTFRYLKKLFKGCIQVTKSNLKLAKINQISDKNTRPTYLRLPGASLSYRPVEDEVVVIGEADDRFSIPIASIDIGTIAVLTDRSEAYRFLPRAIYDSELRKAYNMSPVYSSRTKEELYSPRDVDSWVKITENQIPKAPVAKWLMAGVDEFLREKKHDIENFYFTYLDPTECSTNNLDWLAQHVGLSEPFWNVEWDHTYKRALIKNALGWFEEELTREVGGKEYKTAKGEVLDQMPFNQSTWRSEETIAETEVDLSEIDLSKIGKIFLDTYSRTVSNDNYYLKNDGQKADSFSIYKGDWKGLIESKGSIMSLVFLFSLFNVKAHSAKELELKNGQLIVKSGLRSQENEAPVLLPTKFTLAQVGTSEDRNINVYDNQLVAGVTSITAQEDVNNVFFRLPFYYNRDGKTWNLVESIVKYWMSGALNSRAQYAFLAADLWQQGDAFFEPEIIDESIGIITNAVLTLDGEFYLEAEDNTTILYN